MAYDLNSYETVDVRLKRFLGEHKDARVMTNMERLEDGMVIVKAWVYKNADEQSKCLALSTGYAYEREGKGFVNTTSFIENCETSAIGRALANLGMNGALRPSREEMEKVERMGGAETHGNYPSLNDLEKAYETMNPPNKVENTASVCEFGADKGKRWDTMNDGKIKFYIELYDKKVQNGGAFKAQNEATLQYLLGLRSERIEEVERGK